MTSCRNYSLLFFLPFLFLTSCFRNKITSFCIFPHYLTMHEIFIYPTFYSTKWNNAKSPYMLLSAFISEFVETKNRMCPFTGQKPGLLLAFVLRHNTLRTNLHLTFSRLMTYMYIYIYINIYICRTAPLTSKL
jgi:hypothetical protein